jgi:hypothetical protein
MGMEFCLRLNDLPQKEKLTEYNKKIYHKYEKLFFILHRQLNKSQFTTTSKMNKNLTIFTATDTLPSVTMRWVLPVLPGTVPSPRPTPFWVRR